MKPILSLIFCLFVSIASAQNFEVYVSDAGNFNTPPWQILKFDSTGQNPNVFINTNLAWPQDILFLEDTNIVLISNFSSGRITKHNATTGAFISNFASFINGPTRMKIGPDSLLYVLQWNGNGKVRRYQLNGTYLGEFTSVGVPQSIGIDWDNAGNFYVSSFSDDLVRKFDTSGVDMGIFISSNLVGPTNIWFEPNGDLLVEDYDGGSVKRFDSSGTYSGVFIPGLNNCEGFAFLPNGNILIGNGGTHSVKMFDNTGNYLQEFISSGVGNLITPNAVVVRLVEPVGEHEIKGSINDLVYPTSGNEFNISEKYLSEVKYAELHDSIGNLITKIDEIKNPILNTSEYPTGIYFISVYFKSGGSMSQKIISLE